MSLGMILLITATSATGQPASATAKGLLLQGEDTAAKPIKWGKPILVENFSGTKINTKSWYVYDSPNATPPRSKGAVRVRNGKVELTGGFNAGGKDVSGGMAMRLNQMYGRWEARFRSERGAGYSPVILLWPKTERWPADGEIDIIEVPWSARDKAMHYIHNGPKNTKRGHTFKGDFTRWHTVAVEWLPTKVTYWVDGKKSWVVTDPKLIPKTSHMHLTLQNDWGCNMWAPCRNAQTPDHVTMYVDWVKVYRLPGSERKPEPSSIDPTTPLSTR
ncbi:hypothetical protein Aple_074170 [Acrocarpospora pleiomorpha]|uniref:GH16 domain-containing protein n=1 Tax=Acrocarpospora pleiomorpha TaxID=90975 RepID=A0A5M3Y1C3_9ACTN|nr:glycoside hydrolase family 16 protein [Acrocarpospora pleiomorpha]GES24518.1 hypothetical protein Aple_074170 [Acrocarpospora pleiomorpha]